MDSHPADSPTPPDSSEPPITAEDPIPVSSSGDPNTLPPDDVEAIDELGRVYASLKDELGKVIIGQEEVIEQLAICLFGRGHSLLMGVPGLAKTLLVSSVGGNPPPRIQPHPVHARTSCPPTSPAPTSSRKAGTPGRRQFEFVKGPVFANIVLADEINRAPAKTQSAMLEAMQEHKVTVLGKHLPPRPALLRPRDPEPHRAGRHLPAPEAQLDRFMFLIEVDYPTEEEERRIARETTGVEQARPLGPLINGDSRS